MTDTNTSAITASLTEEDALALVKANLAEEEEAAKEAELKQAAAALIAKATQEAEEQHIAELKAAAPGKLTDDSELYQKTLAILQGMKEVKAGLLEEIAAIQATEPQNPFVANLGARRALVEALSQSYQNLSIDVRRIARSSGLRWPEGL